MSMTLFDDDWIRGWSERIRASHAYREAAQRWESPILLVQRGNAAHGAAQHSIFLDLYRGDCREARVGTAEDTDRVDFVLEADAATWQAIMDGALDPVTGIMRGRLRLTKGSPAALMLQQRAARALLATASEVAAG